jgi:hypothetical protein
MKALLVILTIVVALEGCSDTPSGRWKATAPVDVYAEDTDGAPVAFVLQPGDICALGDKWSVDKALGFKRVSCDRGDGWISFDGDFEKVSETP